MLLKKNLVYSVGLLVFAALFLLVHHSTHNEFMLHLAAIPIEVLVAVFIVERILENREIREKRRQLRLIKSYMFRSHMRNLFLANFGALASPSVSMTDIQNASLEELRAFRRMAENPEYRSLQAMEPVIWEYVRARSVWADFLERAVYYNFEDIVEDMIFILHFIQDVEFFHQEQPDVLVVQAAEGDERLMGKVRKVMGDGIRKFLDYAVELKEKEPRMFDEVLDSYVSSSRFRRAHRSADPAAARPKDAGFQSAQGG
jgi:hypothetical protein